MFVFTLLLTQWIQLSTYGMNSDEKQDTQSGGYGTMIFDISGKINADTIRYFTYITKGMKYESYDVIKKNYIGSVVDGKTQIWKAESDHEVCRIIERYSKPGFQSLLVLRTIKFYRICILYFVNNGNLWTEIDEETFKARKEAETSKPKNYSYKMQSVGIDGYTSDKTHKDRRFGEDNTSKGGPERSGCVQKSPCYIILDLFRPDETAISVYEYQFSGVTHRQYVTNGIESIDTITDGSSIIHVVNDGKCTLVGYHNDGNNTLITLWIFNTSVKLVNFEKNGDKWDKITQGHLFNKLRIMMNKGGNNFTGYEATPCITFQTYINKLASAAYNSTDSLICDLGHAPVSSRCGRIMESGEGRKRDESHYTEEELTHIDRSNAGNLEDYIDISHFCDESVIVEEDERNKCEEASATKWSTNGGPNLPTEEEHTESGKHFSNSIIKVPNESTIEEINKSSNQSLDATESKAMDTENHSPQISQEIYVIESKKRVLIKSSIKYIREQLAFITFDISLLPEDNMEMLKSDQETLYSVLISFPKDLVTKMVDGSDIIWESVDREICISASFFFKNQEPLLAMLKIAKTETKTNNLHFERKASGWNIIPEELFDLKVEKFMVGELDSFYINSFCMIPISLLLFSLSL